MCQVLFHALGVQNFRDKTNENSYPYEAYILIGGDKKNQPVSGTSLVVQWLRICLAMQGTQV